MLFLLKKSILLSLLLLLFPACVSKSDGKYHTKYSYHPYYSLYANKMSNQAPRKSKPNFTSKKENPKLSLNKNTRFPD